MKSQFCFVIAVVVASVSAQAQYRIVQGKIVPRSAPDWTVIYDQIEVKGFAGAALRCSTFTDQEVGTSTTIASAHRTHVVPATTTRRIYKESFVLTNYPAAARFHIGDIVPGPIAVMRIDGIGATALYDYGVEYIPPTRKLTPEEVAAAKVQAAKRIAAGEAAKLKFDEDQAEDGKDLYQYRMGVRYLKGDGVPTDMDKALDYLSKAASQGNQDARKQLVKLSTRTLQSQTNASPTAVSEH